VLIALPGVDCIGDRPEPEPVDGLAEREIGISVVRSELDKAARPQRVADPESKRRMLDPSGRAGVFGHPKRDRRNHRDGVAQ
jgi:hypothetical protein